MTDDSSVGNMEQQHTTLQQHQLEMQHRIQQQQQQQQHQQLLNNIVTDHIPNLVEGAYIVFFYFQ